MRELVYNVPCPRVELTGIARNSGAREGQVDPGTVSNTTAAKPRCGVWHERQMQIHIVATVDPAPGAKPQERPMPKARCTQGTQPSASIRPLRAFMAQCARVCDRVESTYTIQEA